MQVQSLFSDKPQHCWFWIPIYNVSSKISVSHGWCYIVLHLPLVSSCLEKVHIWRFPFRHRGTPIVIIHKNRWIFRIFHEININKPSSQLAIGVAPWLSHRIHGAAIYGDIYHQNTPNVSILPYMDPMGMETPHLYHTGAPKKYDSNLLGFIQTFVEATSRTAAGQEGLRLLWSLWSDEMPPKNLGFSWIF